MKRVFALILCLILLIVPLSVSAEEASENVSEEVVTENHNWAEVKDNISVAVVNWLYDNYDKALVTLFLLMSMLYDRVRDKKNRKDIGTLNNNAITIASDGKQFMGNALSEMQNVSGAVIQYDERITALLAAYQQSAEDRQRLEAKLVEIENYLKINADANIEFANELAELLGLANIPNYKKEELGARHVESVKAILDAVVKAKVLTLPPAEEVKEDAGEEEKD
jgi:hypothetical protein